MVRPPDFLGPSAHLFVPDGADAEDALSRATCMGIGAHQDDLEIFAYHGIESCYDDARRWFGGVTLTDGGGSARAGRYAELSDEEMKRARFDEQNQAARIGRYGFQIQLGHPSAALKDPSQSEEVVAQLAALLGRCRPRTLYLHNPVDKHDTHVAALLRCLEALRRLPPEARPAEIYGCEVWRDLDWLDDDAKIALPVGRWPSLETELLRVFRSQIEGGKDYLAAAVGRRRANATFHRSHAVDEAPGYVFAMDLRPLLQEGAPSLREFAEGHLERFRRDAIDRIARLDRR